MKVNGEDKVVTIARAPHENEEETAEDAENAEETAEVSEAEVEE